MTPSHPLPASGGAGRARPVPVRPPRSPGTPLPGPLLSGPAVPALAGLVCAVLGLVVPSAVAGAAPLADLSPAAVAAPVLAGGVGPLLSSLSLVALLRRRGRLGRAATAATAVGAVVAWALAGAAGLSWNAGFERADAGAPPTASTDAFAGLLLAAVAAGVLALVPVWHGVLPGSRDRRWRVPVAVACAVPTAVVAALLAVSPAGVVLAAALVLLVHLVLRRGRSAPSR